MSKKLDPDVRKQNKGDKELIRRLEASKRKQELKEEDDPITT